MSSTLPLSTFIARWHASKLPEHSAAQPHFIDLCRLLGQPTPTEADPTGSFYTFEKGLTKSDGGGGFADVWKRGHFAWEYKSKGSKLSDAYQQLLKYREDLESPPLLVVCDFDRFEVHTNFTGTVKQVYRFGLPDLADTHPLPGTRLSPLGVLKALFTQPDLLRPDKTSAQVTQEAAAKFATLAESLRRYGVHPERAASFLVRLLFCLFAQDIGLLPAHLLTHMVETSRTSTRQFGRRLAVLFEAMESGGIYGDHDIAHFDGELFAGAEVLELSSDDMDVLLRACKVDWASVEPAIFGTLFERSLDPSKRSQLGAHFTSRDDIELIVEPVLMAPLRREWAEIKAKAEELVAKRDAAAGPARSRHQEALQKLLFGFSSRLAAVRVLDPACGSGNFLYVALRKLMDLEKEALTFAEKYEVQTFMPQVGPEQLHGIETNPYAHQLAQVAIWIGYLQWFDENGYRQPSSPILKPLDNVVEMDAILARDEEGKPVEPEWPAADVIIGNPPFLGGKRLRAALGDGYVDDLFALYDGRVPREADIVCYWFEKARELIAGGRVKRAGLLATQAIRGGANRKVLERIKETGEIFMAWSDREWILNGAAVRISMVGFDGGTETVRTLDGSPVQSVNINLTSLLDLTRARRLPENLGLAFMGDTKGGSFDIPADVARRMLSAPVNPNGRPNSDVVRPWVNGLDVTRRPRDMWIIDFGVDMPEEQAALYEAPFEYVLERIKSERETSRTTRLEWWLHERPRVEMRAALDSLSRYIATVTVSKHRLFAWLAHPTLPDHQLIVIRRADDYFFGLLHSKLHELWARRMGTQLREAESGFRYTPTTTFETFPFPWPPGKEPAGDSRVEAIATAARELVEKRDRWLNPEGATEKDLAQRTLTNLYNRRPAWLDLAHRKLDEAVLDGYGWPHDLPGEEILTRLLALNLERASSPGAESC